MSQFQPEQFATRPAFAQVETELRQWLRSTSIEERQEFLKGLWAINSRYALSLTKTSQLPRAVVTVLLKKWLRGDHNNAQYIIQCFEPLLGKKRFWNITQEVSLTPGMEGMLNYYGKRG